MTLFPFALTAKIIQVDFSLCPINVEKDIQTSYAMTSILVFLIILVKHK